MANSDSDWELLDHSSDESPISDSDPDPDDPLNVLRLDHFSLDYPNQRSDGAVIDAAATVESDEGSVGSDNPSWIEPPLLSDFGSGGAGDVVADHELMDELVDQTMKTTGGVEEWRILGESDESMVAEEEGEEKLVAKAVLEEKREAAKMEEEEAAAVVVEGERKGDEVVVEEEKKVVWWKAPLELLRCCVLKVSPAWSFSVAAAAAVMGFVILGRRLYRMKKRAQVKVSAVDDKKVSQLISHAARLNEAFSVVKRVPVIRPALPSQPGVASWPALSLR